MSPRSSSTPTILGELACCARLLLRAGGRLFVVASTYGSLIALPPQLHARFDARTMTLEDLDSTMLAWRDEVIDGRARHEGWPDFINIPSKVGQVAAIRILARDRRAVDARDGTLVAAVCPGMIDTGASRPWFDMSEALDTRTGRGCAPATGTAARDRPVLLRRARSFWEGPGGSVLRPRPTSQATLGAEGGGTTGPMSPSGASSRSTITGA